MSRECELLKRGKKIVAVGKNYLAHIHELDGKLWDAERKDLVLFLKPTTSYLFQGSPIILPAWVGEVQHEVELAIVIGGDGPVKKVPQDRALECVGGYALALDLSARQLQQKAKEDGAPWAVSKGLDCFCPISSVVPKASIRDPDNLDIWLRVNGELRQQSNTRHMLRSCVELISYVSTVFTLEPGDVILTGTPEGVGPIKPGDVITAGLEGVGNIEFRVEAEQA